MMKEAQALGLQFDPDVIAKYYPIDPKHCLDQVHDSWSPLWGFPTTRQIMTGSAIASTVTLRIQHVLAYRPPNLPPSFPTSPLGLTVDDLT